MRFDIKICLKKIDIIFSRRIKNSSSRIFQGDSRRFLLKFKEFKEGGNPNMSKHAKIVSLSVGCS